MFLFPSCVDLKKDVVGTPARFTVNTRDADCSDLDLSIEGPSKAEINCVDNEDGTCSVDYLITEPGKYTINVKFADKHVKGSPFKAMIRGPGNEEIVVEDVDGLESEPTQRVSQVFEDLVCSGGGVPIFQVQDFVIHLTDYNVKDLETTVVDPNGVELPSEIVESGTNNYTIRFMPKRGGEHIINVKYLGRHIPESPFKLYVEPPVCVTASSDLEEGVVDERGEFTL